MADPRALVAANGCITCLEPWFQTVLGTRRVADWLLVVVPSADVSPSALLPRAGCYACLTAFELTVVRLRLLTDIAVAQSASAPVSADQLSAGMGCWLCMEYMDTAAILALPVVVDETPNATLQRSGCYACLSPGEIAAIEVRLLADILVGLAPASDVSPSALLQRSGCFACWTPAMVTAASGIAAGLVTADVSVTVSPDAPTVGITNIIDFNAVVSGTSSQGVTWSVNGVAGGNATVGTIDSAGVYTAPTDNGRPASVTVRATSTADTSAYDETVVTLPALVGELAVTDFYSALDVGGGDFEYAYTVTPNGGGVIRGPGNITRIVVKNIPGFVPGSSAWNDFIDGVWNPTESPGDIPGTTTVTWELDNLPTTPWVNGVNPGGYFTFWSTIEATQVDGVWTSIAKFVADGGAYSSTGNPPLLTFPA